MHEMMARITESNDVEIMGDEMTMGIEEDEFCILAVDVLLGRDDLSNDEKDILEELKEKIR